MSTDLYDVLRIPRNAGAEEIKRAYRKESLLRHPDRGGTTEDFQQLQHANEILSDPDKRAYYNATGHVPGEGSSADHEEPDIRAMMASMFRSVGAAYPFGGMGGMGGEGMYPGAGQGPTIGPHKIHEIGVSMSDLYHGKTISINMKRDVLCTPCKGKGGMKLEKCTTCSGTGIRTSALNMGFATCVSRGPCDVCHQTGHMAADKCGTCGGRCVVESETVLEALIKPGMQEGDRIVFPGQCSESPAFDKPGDVILIIRSATSDDARWIRSGADLKTEITLKPGEAMLGWERTLDGHPSGEPIHIVWRGGVLQNGSWLRVEGKGMPVSSGMPVPETNGFGSLLLQCKVAQETLSEEQQRILQSVWPNWRAPQSTETSLEAVRN